MSFPLIFPFGRPVKGTSRASEAGKTTCCEISSNSSKNELTLTERISAIFIREGKDGYIWLLSTWEMVLGVTPTSLASSVCDRLLFGAKFLQTGPQVNPDRGALFIIKDNIQVFAPVIPWFVQAIETPLFSLYDYKTSLAPFQREVSDLGYFVDMGLETLRMSSLFNNPVSDGIQFIQPWTGVEIKFYDMFFPTP